MALPALDVLYEDNHLLAVSKPVGLATMGLRGDQATLLSEAKAYIKQKYAKPGNVYLGIVSRLDAPVTGIVLMARTSKAAARLTAAFRDHLVQKTYWAIVAGHVEPAEGELIDWLLKDERHRRMHAVEPGRAGARQARLTYRRLKLPGERSLHAYGGSLLVESPLPYKDSLLEVQLHTGRKHQIRVQLAERGHPVLGDLKYGSRRSFPHGIALHAWRLVLEHPVRRQPIEIVAPLPPYWPRAACQEDGES